MKERNIEISALENERKTKSLIERSEYEKKYAISHDEWMKMKEAKDKLITGVIKK